MNVEQIMTIAAKTCRPYDTLHQVAQMMWDHDFGAVPVVNDAGEPIAMITDRDICMACYTQGKAPGEIAVSSAMSSKIVTVAASEAVSTAEALMRSEQVRRLPVVGRHGELVGMLSLNDIATHAHPKKVALHREELGADAVASTLAAICARPKMAHAAE